MVKPSQMKRPYYILIIGDALVIFLLVFVGIRFHQSDPSQRLLYTLLPFLLAWFFAASFLGVLTPLAWGKLWRILPTMLLAAPLGSILRSAWLGTVALPIFTLIMGATLALGLLAWRAIYSLVFARGSR